MREGSTEVSVKEIRRKGRYLMGSGMKLREFFSFKRHFTVY
jgi:hypothetical protein